MAKAEKAEVRMVREEKNGKGKGDGLCWVCGKHLDDEVAHPHRRFCKRYNPQPEWNEALPAAQADQTLITLQNPAAPPAAQTAPTRGLTFDAWSLQNPSQAGSTIRRLSEALDTRSQTELPGPGEPFVRHPTIGSPGVGCKSNSWDGWLKLERTKESGGALSAALARDSDSASAVWEPPQTSLEGGEEVTSGTAENLQVLRAPSAYAGDNVFSYLFAKTSASEISEHPANGKIAMSLAKAIEGGNLSMNSIFRMAQDDGRLPFAAMEDLQESKYTSVERGRPPGYCAQTTLHVGNLNLVALLDYGATCSGLPEELALAIIAHAVDMLTAHPSSEKPLNCPIRSIFRIRNRPRIDGLAKGQPSTWAGL